MGVDGLSRVTKQALRESKEFFGSALRTNTDFYYVSTAFRHRFYDPSEPSMAKGLGVLFGFTGILTQVALYATLTKETESFLPLLPLFVANAVSLEYEVVQAVEEYLPSGMHYAGPLRTASFTPVRKDDFAKNNSFAILAKKQPLIPQYHRMQHK